MAAGSSMRSMLCSAWPFGGADLQSSENHLMISYALPPRGVWFLYRLDLGVSVTTLAFVQVRQ